jgi:hypothetical protein
MADERADRSDVQSPTEQRDSSFTLSLSSLSRSQSASLQAMLLIDSHLVSIA